MAQRLFLSYRTDDAVFAGRIYDALRQRFGAERIFFDQRSIRAGAKWDAEIDRSLAESSVFVLVITPRWSSSFAERAAEGGRDYHLREIELALDRGMPILPLVIDDAVPPSDATLPDSLRGRLSMIQWERVRNDRSFDDSMERLGAQLAWVLDGGAPRGPVAAMPPAPGWMAPPPPAPRSAPGSDAGSLLATKEWRRNHSVWPWGLLCCGIATGPVFLYMGARTKTRAWLIAGGAYLAIFLVLMGAYSLVSDGIPSPSTSASTSVATSTTASVEQDTSPAGASATEPETAAPTGGETAVSMVFAIYVLVGFVHLLAVNSAWLRLRAAEEVGEPGPHRAAPPSPPPAAPPGGRAPGSAF